MLELRPDLEELGMSLIAVGFSPPEALATLAAHLSWPFPFCSDEQRLLYDRLGLGRAGPGQIFTPATRALYTAAAERGITAERPVEDIRQLGGDAVVVAGTARLTFRPSSPEDRPTPTELLEAARSVTCVL